MLKPLAILAGAYLALVAVLQTAAELAAKPRKTNR